MQRNIEAEKFLLAIVGEVKAGKSTFINALLREAMLPYDTLQATSEIVEIYKSEKKEARVTFANGNEKVVEDDPQTPENEAVPFLKKIAAVNNEYRDIPVVQVNRFLIDHYSKEKGKAVFRDEELEELFGPELENIHRLAQKEFEDNIREYIEKNISCDEIPKKITLGYPLDFSQFKHFRIVDTPGINAIGGIENQTKEFINQADAVIYLHKAGQQESQTLRNALENELPERVQKHLILVLTHRSHSDENERERILEATVKYYPKIGKDNIFFVDSLTELCLRESFNRKTMDEIKAIRTENSTIQRLTAPCFEKAEGDKNEFFNLLEAEANFDKIRKRIAGDAQKSASIQLKSFASAMQEGYEALDNKIGAHIEPLRKNYKDPQSFASEIQKHKDETERMRRDCHVFIGELEEEFYPQDLNSRYYREINQIVERYREKVNNKKFESDTSTLKIVESYLEKLGEDFNDETKRFGDSLKADFQKRIEEKDVGAQGNYSITIPKISVRIVWEEASNEAKKEIEAQLDEVEKSKGWGYHLSNIILVGIPFIIKESKKDDIRKSRPQETWKKIQPQLTANFTNVMTGLQKEIGAMINNFCTIYKDKFDKELRGRQQFMENLEKDSQKNEEWKDKILSLEAQKKTFEDNIKTCIKVRGEL